MDQKKKQARKDLLLKKEEKEIFKQKVFDNLSVQEAEKQDMFF